MKTRLSVLALLAAQVFIFSSNLSAVPTAQGMKPRTYPAKQAAASPAEPAKPSLRKDSFGRTQDGKDVDIYTIRGAGGMMMKVISYGGIITELYVPDKNGKYANITLGFDKLSDYEKNKSYFGALIGRYGNRLAKGTFKIDGEEFHAPINDGENTLHGGIEGFNKKIWNVEPIRNDVGIGVKLTRLSPAGEEGFPGNLQVEVNYILTPANELIFEYSATTDAPTVCNLTQHLYFNLLGAGKGSIENHEAAINSAFFTPVDKGLIPTGEILSVQGTPFDFKTPKKIGLHVNDTTNEQIRVGGGYDHNFILNKPFGELSFAAFFHEPTTGRLMKVFTTEPAVQFYSGNFLDGKDVGLGGAYQHRGAFAFETQHYPDSPNRNHFPSTLLRPGQKYSSKTVYRFETK